MLIIRTRLKFYNETLNEFILKKNVEVLFANKRIAKILNSEKRLKKKFGARQARKLMRRLYELQAAEVLEDLRNAPGRFHELANDRKGQLACDLLQPARLIFVPLSEPPPLDERGSLLWTAVERIMILDIIDYH